MIPPNWQRRSSRSSIQGGHPCGGSPALTHSRQPSRRLETSLHRSKPTATCRHRSHTTTPCPQTPDEPRVTLRHPPLRRTPMKRGQHAMTSKLAGTAALVTGASSGIGAATARRLAEEGASVTLVARRQDRLEALAAEIDQVGGTALVVEADITDRAQAEVAVQRAVERFGRLDIVVNNAGLMLLGAVVGADAEEWDRMIAINVHVLLYTTSA